ncbi:unnamed protein product [Nezara viridula]|uniref:YEATS domain-containing protein n=1 Tax=Nezara viridula TaxID=85310 RepID=A0A9P0HLM8_NEZVI|nr:unnamed protein product [Nezara viridula]
MHSNISECDTELEIPSKKIKLSPVQENCKTKERILSKVLQKEIQQEINLRKDDLELIEGNIFLVRQKLIQLKQVLAAEYYRQKSVKGCLQYHHHPAVKDTFRGKYPVGYEGSSSVIATSNEAAALGSPAVVKKEFEPAQEVSNDEVISAIAHSAQLNKLLEHDKLPCYIPPKNTDDNVVKPTEPRGIDSKKEIRIIVGNVSKWLAPMESSDATHKWTVYAKLAQTNLDISLFVKKVVFFLHKSYRPNDIIEIKYPPFKLTRRGWGEFPLKAQFHFKSPENPPIDVLHHLKLDHNHTGFETFGAETSLTVWVHYPLENGFVKDINKPTEEIIIKTEDVSNNKIKGDQIASKLNTFQQNIFGNSDVISDISLNANIDSFENEISSGGFSFPEHSCDSESISSLFDEMKHEELQSLTNFIAAYGESIHSNQNFVKGDNCNEVGLNSGKNKIMEDKTNFEGTSFSNKNFPETSSVRNEIMKIKQEIEDKFSSTQSFQELNSIENKIVEIKPKTDEKLSEINFNEFEREGLFVDECAVVAEEIVIEDDECELDSNNDQIEENGKTSLHIPIDTKDCQQTCKNHITHSLSNSSIFSETSSFDSLKKHENNSFASEMSLDSIVQQLGIQIDDGNKSAHNIETDKSGQLKDIEVLSVLQDQKSNKIIPKSSIEVINGLPLINNRKVQKNTEKKSMIITLQKENGQIILRKEAKVQKFKDSSPKKGPVPVENKSILVNNKSLVNSNPIPIKNNRIIVDVKKQLAAKLPNQQSSASKNVPSASRITAVSTNSSLQKKSLPGVSILKKAKNVNKEDHYEDISNHDLVRQCPIQNTEIAVNWLMKKFPLVDTRSTKAAFHVRHPYCAKDRDAFLNWPFAKQRAAEWMRAKSIGRILNEIPHLEKWTTLEILDWARVRCYTPIRNIPGCVYFIFISL